MIEGNFIVLEGVDGAGTTTHTKLLQAHFQTRGLPVRTTREPSDGPVGMLLRQILTGRIVVPGMRGGRPPSWTTMALLFAADRMDHGEATIVPNLMDGVTVLSDRYDYSSVAYQSTTGGGTDDVVTWVRELNRHARRPHLTLVLDVPSEVAAERRQSRGAGREMYDDGELQETLGRFYTNIEQYFPDDNIVHVDANRPMEAVAEEIQHHVAVLRNEA